MSSTSPTPTDRTAPGTYSPKAVANYFLERGFENGEPIDPMKLQKLVYYAHGWSLAINRVPLIDETVEAWPYGPVIPTVYHAFKIYGNRPIDSLAFEVRKGQMTYPRVPGWDAATQRVLDRVWEVYGGHSGIELSELSHLPGSPWDRTWQEAQKKRKRRGVDIPDERIEEHFRQEGFRNRVQSATAEG